MVSMTNTATTKVTRRSTLQVSEASAIPGAKVGKSTAEWALPAVEVLALIDAHLAALQAEMARTPDHFRRSGLKGRRIATFSLRRAVEAAAQEQELTLKSQDGTVDAMPKDTAAKKTPAKKAAAPKRLTKAQQERAAAAGSAIIAAIEAAYKDVQANHPDLPTVVFITGTGLMGRGAKWGHYWRHRWVPGSPVEVKEDTTGGAFAAVPGRLPEIFIAGERLACGAEDTLETILHEAAHALAVVRDIKDTSKEGRYHNGEFKALSEELGLEFAGERPDPIIGYSNTRLTDATRKRYAKTIKTLGKAIGVYLDTFHRLGLVTDGEQGQGGDGNLKGGKGATGGQAKPKDRNHLKASCSCETPRTIRLSKKTALEAPVLCGLCKGEFVAEGLEDES